MPDDKAVGIVVVVALTLFASLLYGYVGAISAGVYAISGGAAAEGNPAETNEIMLITLPFTLMAMYAFLLSILILRVNSKIVWFAAIAFWVANAIFWVQLVLGWGNFWEADLLQLHLTLLRVPSLYSLTCTGYFKTPHVRQHFNLQQNTRPASLSLPQDTQPRSTEKRRAGRRGDEP